MSAVPCEKLAAVLTDDVIEADPQLANIGLLRTEWMNGLMFYLKKRVDVTKGHVNFVDSGWAITSISEEQFWKRSLTTYGDGTVKDCMSAIISDWSTPGNFNRKSARDCTPDEIADEAWAQIKAHLNDTDTVVDDQTLHPWFLDPSIIDSGTPNVRNDEPLFIQDPGSWNRRPAAVTGIDNLFLAGEWIKTDQNVTTMEGANEGGRYAANGVLQASGYSGERVKIVELFQAPWWVPFKAVDRGALPRGPPARARQSRHAMADVSRGVAESAGSASRTTVRSRHGIRTSRRSRIHPAPIPAPTREWSRVLAQFGLDGSAPEDRRPSTRRWRTGSPGPSKRGGHTRDLRGVRPACRSPRASRRGLHNRRCRRQRRHAVHQPTHQHPDEQCRPWCTCTAAAWRSSARPTPYLPRTGAPRRDWRSRRRCGIPQLRREARPAPVPRGTERLRSGGQMGGR